jgi:predicted ArsR family transcriptional regulator
MYTLQSILGSESSEQVLIYILARSQGYPTEIADFYQVSKMPIQKQMAKLEAGNVLASRLVGRTRLYQFNTRYPFFKELIALLEKALSFYPESLQEELRMNRRRPRQAGKPL